MDYFCYLSADLPIFPIPDSRLRLSQAQGNLSILETQQVQLECVVLNRTSTASQLVVEWFVWKPNHPERETVARLSREATFHYGEQAAKNHLQGRLHLESPSSGVYRLFIQNVAVQDSGTYSCRVEEWLPSPSGVWYKRAEDTAGQTAVTVMRPGECARPWPPHPEAPLIFIFLSVIIYVLDGSHFSLTNTGG